MHPSGQDVVGVGGCCKTLCSAGFEHIEYWFHSMPPKLSPISVPIEARLAVPFWTMSVSWEGLFSLCKQLRPRGQSRSRPWGPLKKLKIRVTSGLQGWAEVCGEGSVVRGDR